MMVQQTNSNIEDETNEATNGSPAHANGGRVDLEPTDAYIRRTKADVHRSKAQAANRVALVLVLGLVLSLPLYIVMIGLFPSEVTTAHFERVFIKWYDVMSPLVGAVIGALFGLSLSDRKGREERT
jgi:hypothetical protein